MLPVTRTINVNIVIKSTNNSACRASYTSRLRDPVGSRKKIKQNKKKKLKQSTRGETELEKERERERERGIVKDLRAGV